MLIGYVRVLSKDEDLDLQINALKEFGCKKIFIDKLLETDISKRPNFEEMKTSAKEGDCLVVWKLAKLGVGLFGLLRLMEELQKRKIHFISLVEEFDTRGDRGDYFFRIVASFAEMEKELNIERINAGLAASRAKGIVGGRKPSMDQSTIEKAILLLKQGKTPQEVMLELHIKKSTFYATIDTKKLTKK